MVPRRLVAEPLLDVRVDADVPAAVYGVPGQSRDAAAGEAHGVVQGACRAHAGGIVLGYGWRDDRDKVVMICH